MDLSKCCKLLCLFISLITREINEGLEQIVGFYWRKTTPAHPWSLELMVTTTFLKNWTWEEMALEPTCCNYPEVWLTTVKLHSFVHSINLNFLSQDPSRIQIMVETDKLKRSHFLSLMKRLLQGVVQDPGSRRREVLPSLGLTGAVTAAQRLSQLDADIPWCFHWRPKGSWRAREPVSTRVLQRNRINRIYTDMYEIDDRHWLMWLWRLRSSTVCCLPAIEQGKSVV